MDIEITPDQARLYVQVLENGTIVSSRLFGDGKGIVFKVRAAAATSSFSGTYKLYCYNGVTCLHKREIKPCNEAISGLNGKAIRNVIIHDNNQLYLSVDDWSIQTRTNAERIMWLLRRPNSEENILMGFPDSLILRKLITKRWSVHFGDSQAACHSAHNALQKKHVRENRVPAPLSFVDMILDDILGKYLSSAEKSSDSNLYVFKFGNNEDLVVVEVFCQIQFVSSDGKCDIFYGDSEQFLFSERVACLLNNMVQEISLDDENNLEIVFENCRLKFLTADDGMLSWLIGRVSEQNPLLLVSCDDCYMVEQKGKGANE